MAEHDQQFNSMQEWVNKGRSWLTRRQKLDSNGCNYFKAICFDAKNRLVENGGDFKRAEDEGAFPIRWLWPDQIAEIAAKHPLFGEKELCPICDNEAYTPGKECKCCRVTSISEQAKGYLDRVIKLNTEAMGDRDQWDTHGNAILDLVRDMGAAMDALRQSSDQS
jgi:hypothetical protein